MSWTLAIVVATCDREREREIQKEDLSSYFAGFESSDGHLTDVIEPDTVKNIKKQ